MKKLFIAIALILAFSTAKDCNDGIIVEENEPCPDEIEPNQGKLEVEAEGVHVEQDDGVNKLNVVKKVDENGMFIAEEDVSGVQEAKERNEQEKKQEKEKEKKKEKEKERAQEQEHEQKVQKVLPDFVPRNYRYKEDNFEYPECKKEVLNLIGIEGSILKSQEATPKERMFCHRNQYTCCTHKEIVSLQLTFKEHLKDYNKEVSVLEELLTAFRGPKFSEFFSETLENQTEDFQYCKGKAEAVSSDYWSFHFKAQYITEVETLFNDIEKYTKRNVYWAANTVCSICDPFNHRFFDMESKIVKGNAGTCREILEEREFELRFARVFNSFIRPTALAMRCILNKEFKNKEENKNEAVDELSPIEETQINSLLEKFSKCYFENQEGITSETNCEELCDRKLGTFKTSVPIVRAARRGLSEIFKYLMGGEDSIEDYYEDTKDMEFYNEKEEAPVVFLQAIEGKTTLGDLKWEYVPAGGIVVMTDHMQKKFYKFAPALTTALLALIAFLF